MRYWPNLNKRNRFLATLLSMLVLASCGRDATASQEKPLLQSETAKPTGSQPDVEEIQETWIAVAKGHVTELVAFERPEGPTIALPFAVPNPHQFGNAMTLMVTEGDPDDPWVKVQLPSRPNGQQGWIRSSDYQFSSTKIRAEVDLSDTSVVVYDGNRVIAETKAVVGSSATPTPLGTFYVTAKKANQEAYLGPWALALSSFSEAHETFAGGLPVIAIHGTNRPEQVGDARSNGCIRIPNEVVTKLAETVPLGAPVTISA